ncbi:MAG: DnaJ domain-containing protein [Sphingomonas bacterium]|nr:DnaJ domain-containing protein [Sphingomonas bacterium]
MTPDHYATLGVPSTANAAAIRAAYLALMREYHPDRNPDPAAVERAQTIIAAFKVLGDFDRRNHHDWDRRREREAAAAAAIPNRKIGAGVVAGALGLAAVSAWLLTPTPRPEPARRVDPPVAGGRPAPVAKPTRANVAPPSGDRVERGVAKAAPIEPADTPEPPAKVEMAKIEPRPATPVRVAKVEPKPIKPGRVATVEPGPATTARSRRVPVKVAERSTAAAAPAPSAAPPPVSPAAARQAKAAAKPTSTAPRTATDLASLDQFVMAFYGQSWRYGDAPKRAALERSRSSFVVRRGECAAESCQRAAYLKLMRDVSEIVETGQPRTR